MKKRKMQEKIKVLEKQVVALERRIHFLEIANTCRKYTDVSRNKKPYQDKVYCYNNYSAREFI